MPNPDTIFNEIQKAHTAYRSINKVRVTFLMPAGMMARWMGEILIHPDDWDRIVASVASSPTLTPLTDQVWGVPVVKDPAVVTRDTARAWVNEACERWYQDNA